MSWLYNLRTVSLQSHFSRKYGIYTCLKLKNSSDFLHCNNGLIASKKYCSQPPTKSLPKTKGQEPKKGLGGNLFALFYYTFTLGSLIISPYVFRYNMENFFNHSRDWWQFTGLHVVC